MEYIDYEKAFDSTEHEAILKALKTIGINETYMTILVDIYTGATARVHMDNQVSEEIPMLRGVRQGDPIPFQFIHSNNSGGGLKCPDRRKRHKFRWRKTAGRKFRR